jgi:alkaline phosphatase D
LSGAETPPARDGGINPPWGGMKIDAQMRHLHPDFCIHNGDSIDADDPIPAEVHLDDGTIWTNITIPERTKVAETLAEFRANYLYNDITPRCHVFHATLHA